MTGSHQSPEPIAQLRAAITASGLSVSAYARDILIRDQRTVRRWLSGESPIPQSVRDYLKLSLKSETIAQASKTIAPD